MNRRNLLSFLAGLPVIGAARAEVPKLDLPLGWMVDFAAVENRAAGLAYQGAGNHELAMETVTVFRRHIWDGNKFVPFDSPEATAVLNLVLHGRSK